MKIKGNSVLITGGASGIGRLMARMSVEKGASAVILWDINKNNLAVVKEELQKMGGSTKIFDYCVDVSNNDCVVDAYSKSKAESGRVDIVINCAGIVTSNNFFENNSVDEIDRTIRINTIAPMYVAHAAIGDMIGRNSGHICNIASAAGMISNPRMSIYASSKWAVIGWSDSVRVELQERKSKVRVTTIAPFYINTGMFDGVKSRIIPILDPVKTARRILRAIEKDKTFKGLPFSFHFIRFFQGLLPNWFFDWFFGRVFGIYHTMDHFTGRK